MSAARVVTGSWTGGNRLEQANLVSRTAPQRSTIPQYEWTKGGMCQVFLLR